MIRVKYKHIVFNGTIHVEERDALPVRKNEVLGKTLSIYIGFLESLIENGLIPVNPPKILGSYAVLRILEDQGSEPNYSGRLVITNPYGEKGFLGIHIDGVLGTYVSLPRTYIYSEVSDKNPYNTLIPLIDHCIYLAEKAEGSTLIVGCNIYSLTTFYAYTFIHNAYPDLYCPDKNIFRKIKFKPLRNLSELNSSYDTIILTSPKHSIIENVLEKSRSKQMIISKFSFLKYIPLKHLGEFHVIYTHQTSKNPVIRGKITKILKKIIRVVEIDDVEKIVNYFSRIGLGVIVKFSA